MILLKKARSQNNPRFLDYFVTWQSEFARVPFASPEPHTGPWVRGCPDGLLQLVLVWSLREELPGCLRQPLRQVRFAAVVVFFSEVVVRDVLSQTSRVLFAIGRCRLGPRRFEDRPDQSVEYGRLETAPLRRKPLW